MANVVNNGKTSDPPSHHFPPILSSWFQQYTASVNGREESPMTSFDAKTDFKPLHIVIISN